MSGSYQIVQDSMLGLKRLYEVIDSKTKIEDIAGFENAYIYENRMSRTNAHSNVMFNFVLITKIIKFADRV